MDEKRLRAVLGTPELAWLVDRLRRRAEAGRDLTGTVSLRDPSPEERRAVDRLLGRLSSRGRSLQVRLDQLAELLRHAELAGDLRSAVEAVTGPLADRRAEHEERERRWHDLFAEAEAAAGRPAEREWLGERRTRLLLRRFSGHEPRRGGALLDQALAVVRRLPERGVALAELAAAVTGDSHALDAGRPLGTLLVTAAARLGGVDDWHGAEARREVWEAVGVVKDDVSASVLVLGLTAVGDGLADRVLRLHAAAGEPCRLTTGLLLRDPPRFDAASPLDTVYVCENPAVVSAAARRLGASGAPLVCVEGQPVVAVHLLLARLAAAGVRLLYHGDFDWTGLRIAGRLMARHGAGPWRFGAADYLAAAGGVPLAGDPVEPPWDAALAPAMRARGLAVHEEQVLDVLLADLALGPNG